MRSFGGVDDVVEFEYGRGVGGLAVGVGELDHAVEGGLALGGVLDGLELLAETQPDSAVQPRGARPL